MKEAFCRLDGHWCIECCITGCTLLGDIGDEELGCLGHNGKRSRKLTERPCCLETDCLALHSPEDREIIRQDISKLPPGEFRMSEILSQHKNGKIICVQCRRIIWRFLDLEGEILSTCEECFKAVKV